MKSVLVIHLLKNTVYQAVASYLAQLQPIAKSLMFRFQLKLPRIAEILPPQQDIGWYFVLASN
ncbi:hypothetical protein [Allocoleopsis sp.]|uniref:hypothetical protein n=1 Tax=Allocoleopsis sp. TaxID=3088169 RepID=UPI002FD5A952